MTPEQQALQAGLDAVAKAMMHSTRPTQTEQPASLPKGITVKKAAPQRLSPETECEVVIQGGVIDRIVTNTESRLIHMHLTGKRREGCDPSDYRAWISTAIQRLQDVIVQLDAILKSDE